MFGGGVLVGTTAAGEDFRPIVEMMSVWRQSWAQGLIGPEDLDPKMLLWGVQRQICPAEIPASGFVIRFDFHVIPKRNRKMEHSRCMARRAERRQRGPYWHLRKCRSSSISDLRRGLPRLRRSSVVRASLALTARPRPATPRRS
jgi:hypothetical protein